MFRVQQSTKPSPSVCSPIQKIHSTPMRLWISNIPFYWSTIELEKIFSVFGQVYDVEIPLKNGQSRGYGFVTFEKQSDAIRAIQSMDGQVINGRSMQVYQAHIKQKSLIKSYFIKSFDRSLFSGYYCCCCQSNAVSPVNYAQFFVFAVAFVVVVTAVAVVVFWKTLFTIINNQDDEKHISDLI